MAPTVEVSVCIPVYNGEETIARTISSVLAAQQRTGNRVEIIIVDDNSNDRTIQNIEPFLCYDYVRLEWNVQNLGLAGNWQRALSLGTGQIVTLLHMDDWYGPECLQVVSSAFAEDPALAMLAPGQTFYDQDGRVVPSPTHRIATFTGHEYADFQLR